MPKYTEQGVYRTQLDYLLEKFLEDNERDPNGVELAQLEGEAREYAERFMEEWADYQNDAARDDRNTR